MDSGQSKDEQQKSAELLILLEECRDLLERAQRISDQIDRVMHRPPEGQSGSDSSSESP